MNDLKKYKKMLKEIKGTLNVWKDKGLTNKEKYINFFIIELNYKPYSQKEIRIL